jgi:hypothetical protein
MKRLRRFDVCKYLRWKILKKRNSQHKFETATKLPENIPIYTSLKIDGRKVISPFLMKKTNAESKDKAKSVISQKSRQVTQPCLKTRRGLRGLFYWCTVKLNSIKKIQQDSRWCHRHMESSLCVEHCFVFKFKPPHIKILLISLISWVPFSDKSSIVAPQPLTFQLRSLLFFSKLYQPWKIFWLDADVFVSCDELHHFKKLLHLP